MGQAVWPSENYYKNPTLLPISNVITFSKQMDLALPIKKKLKCLCLQYFHNTFITNFK